MGIKYNYPDINQTLDYTNINSGKFYSLQRGRCRVVCSGPFAFKIICALIVSQDVSGRYSKASVVGAASTGRRGRRPRSPGQ